MRELEKKEISTYDVAKAMWAADSSSQFADFLALAKLLNEFGGGPVRTSSWMKLPAAKRLCALGLLTLNQFPPDPHLVKTNRRIMELQGIKFSVAEYKLETHWSARGKWFVSATESAIRRFVDIVKN